MPLYSIDVSMNPQCPALLFCVEYFLMDFMYVPSCKFHILMSFYRFLVWKKREILLFWNPFAKGIEVWLMYGPIWAFFSTNDAHTIGITHVEMADLASALCCGLTPGWTSTSHVSRSGWVYWKSEPKQICCGNLSNLRQHPKINSYYWWKTSQTTTWDI